MPKNLSERDILIVPAWMVSKEPPEVQAKIQAMEQQGKVIVLKHLYAPSVIRG